MKAYGYTRRDKLVCSRGCCQMKSNGKLRNFRKTADRVARKAGRRVSLLELY